MYSNIKMKSANKAKAAAAAQVPHAACAATSQLASQMHTPHGVAWRGVARRGVARHCATRRGEWGSIAELLPRCAEDNGCVVACALGVLVVGC